jgi:hypothetical protein
VNVTGVYSRRDGGFTHFFRIPPPPIFSEVGGKSYIEKEVKISTNVKHSHFSIKSPPISQILEWTLKWYLKALSWRMQKYTDKNSELL